MIHMDINKDVMNWLCGIAYQLTLGFFLSITALLRINNSSNDDKVDQLLQFLIARIPTGESSQIFHLVQSCHGKDDGLAIILHGSLLPDSPAKLWWRICTQWLTSDTFHKFVMKCLLPSRTYELNKAGLYRVIETIIGLLLTSTKVINCSKKNPQKNRETLW